MTNPIFGEPWDAPICEGARRVATPVGRKCLFCQLPIGQRDRGFLVRCGRAAADGQPYTTIEFEHRECLTRAVAGSPAHLDGTCPCRNDGGPDPFPSEPEALRAEALAVWQRLHGAS